MPHLLAPLRALLVASGLFAASLVSAQVAPQGRISVPEFRFRGTDVQAELEKAGWTISGTVRRGTEPGSIAIEPGSTVSRIVAHAPIAFPDGVKLSPPEVWTFVASARVRKASEALAEPARIRMTLAAADAAEPFAHASAVMSDRSQTLRIRAPLAEVPLGELRLTIEVKDGPIALDHLELTRVPIDPEAMVFAKSNGHNGPDRVVSGALGFVGHSAHRHAPLPIYEVFAEGPAALAGLKAGDLLLAVEGEDLLPSSAEPGPAWFGFGHEAVLGRAVEAALATDGRQVSLRVARGADELDLSIGLTPRPALPEDFPFDQIATPRLEADLLAYIRKHQRPNGSWQENGIPWIQSAFAGLALLGQRDPQDLDRLERCADYFLREFAHPDDFGNLAYWSAAYSGIFLTEWWFATGDERVPPWIERTLRSIEAGFHTTPFGVQGLGHGPSGLPYEDKGLIAPASHVLVFEALAQRGGIAGSVHQRLAPYLRATWSDPKEGGHGAMGYNPSYKDQGEFWSRTGLCALAATLRNDDQDMREGMVQVMKQRHAWMRNSHAYGQPGDVWGLVGLARTDRAAFREVMRAWRPFFGGMWEPGFGLRPSTAHMGAPYMGEEGLVNPAVAMLLTVRRDGLVITGADPTAKPWLRRTPGQPAARRVIAEVGRDGTVTLRPDLLGARVAISLDGRPPRADGPIYSEPLRLPQGGLVRASVVLESGGLGPETRLEVYGDKSAWRIVEATGDAAPESAVQRAEGLIDGEVRRPWQPDVGKGFDAKQLTVAIDLGSPTYLQGVRFRGANLPKAFRLSLHGEDPRAPALAVIESKDQGLAAGEELLRARYIRIAITEPPEAERVRLGELDLVLPEVSWRLEDGHLHPNTPPAGLAIHIRAARPDSTFAPLTGPLKVLAEHGFLYVLVHEDSTVITPERPCRHD